MIRTLEGRVGSGKTTKVLREAAQEAAGGGRALLIVPEQMTLSAELQLSAELEAPGFLLAEVLSPSRLMRRVNEAAGGLAGRVIIDERGRAMALRAALCELEGTLLTYNGCAGREGFVAWLADLLGECAQSDISPAELRVAAGALESEALQSRLLDIASIHERYLSLLEGRFLDTGEATELFLRNVPNVDFLRGARVWVDGFDIMPPRTLRMIVALAGAASEVTVALTLPEEDEGAEGLFSPVRQSLKRLRHLAGEAGIALARQRLPREAYHSPEIGHLERQWDEYPPLPHAGTPRDIQLVHAQTPGEECEFAAAAMLALHRDQGVPFGSMACAPGDEGRYAPLMRRALQARGIPCFIAQPLTAAGHPLARWWLAAMEAGAGGMHAGAMGRALRSGWCGAGEDEADSLINRMVACNLRGKMWERAIDGDEALEKARAALVRPIASYARRLRGKPSAREMAHAAWLLLEEAGAYPRLTEAIDRCEARGEGVAAEQHAQAWNCILEGLDQAVELLGDRVLPHAEFLYALEAGLREAQLSALPPRPDQVMVTSISRVKGSGIRALFVLGLNADVLPAPAPEGGLLSDADRARLNMALEECSMELHLNGTLEKGEADAFSIYSALTLPTERLYLSYASSGEDGTALRRSPLADRILTIFPDLSPRDRPDEAAESGISALWQAAAALRSGEDSEEAGHIWRYFLDLPEAQEEVERIRQALLPGPAEGGISPESAGELFGGGIGITRLEAYAQCPCKHFIQSGLRPRELHPPGVRPVDAGTLYHAALEEFVFLASRGGTPWAEMTNDAVDALLEEAMRAPIQSLMETPGYEGGVIESQVAELKRVLRKTASALAFQLRGSGFVPRGGEVAFGAGKPFPPLELALPEGGEVSLEGRIDRVDIFDGAGGTLLRVVDYKSGEAEIKRETVESGLTLQLPLYALEAERAFGGEAAGLFYGRVAEKMLDVTNNLPGDEEDTARRLARVQRLSGMLIDDPDIAMAMDEDLHPDAYSDRINVRLNADGNLSRGGGRVLPREDFRALLITAKDVAAGIAQRMLAGEAQPEPANIGRQRTACSYCLYRGICKYG